MKNLLIIYPHWPPANLAGVHRARLIANFIQEFGWSPNVLTVRHEFYEEKLDWDLCKLTSPDIQVEYVDARPVKRASRVVGDIGIRAYSFLEEKALEMIKEKNIDFIWIPIPSFYVALLGRKLHSKTGIPYGIDYIDPWVDGFTDTSFMSKGWISNQVAKFLEPYAVSKASLISGVSTSYYQPVLDRNFKDVQVVHVGMPYGFDPNDHDVILPDLEYPWSGEEGVKPYVYAGAFLPKSHTFLQLLFKGIARLREEGQLDDKIRLYFLGTGPYAGVSITDYAEQMGISDVIVEIRDRFPFVHILNFLGAARGVMVIGSTEEHYTASKVFQSLLSKNPVFAVFHQDSSAVKIMNECNGADYLVEYDPIDSEDKLGQHIAESFRAFVSEGANWKPQLDLLSAYSSRTSAELLAGAMYKVIVGSVT